MGLFTFVNPYYDSTESTILCYAIFLDFRLRQKVLIAIIVPHYFWSDLHQDLFSVICLESVKDAEERESLRRSLENSGKTIIEISLDQMHSFAGNMLQLYSESGRSVLVMSESAFKSLNWDQLDKLKMFCEVLPVKVDTIEKASGGSVRCMMAEICPSFTL